MNQLDDVVAEVIKNFVNNGVLFTALDVSNAVKTYLPMSRHKEVRDIVRALYISNIEPNSYGKTPIKVSLSDGSTAEAILYHPLVDSWDLDNKYDNQRRAQSSKSGAVQPAPMSAPVTVASNGTINVVPVAPPPAPAAAPTDPKSQWMNLFATSPSLFPAK